MTAKGVIRLLSTRQHRRKLVHMVTGRGVRGAAAVQLSNAALSEGWMLDAGCWMLNAER